MGLIVKMKVDSCTARLNPSCNAEQYLFDLYIIEDERYTGNTSVFTLQCAAGLSALDNIELSTDPSITSL